MIIYGEIGAGKTTEMIKLSRDTGCNLVVERKSIANQLKMRALRENEYLPEVLTYEDIINNKLVGKRLEGLLIDDIENLVEYITKQRVEALSTSMWPKQVKLPLWKRIKRWART